MIGTHVAHYEIVSRLGSGGMGEVYLARDTKLNREVAVKVLLPAVANDPERMARFEREARTLASMNHPNIGSIHGLEESNGVTALILEASMMLPPKNRLPGLKCDSSSIGSMN